jgi:hypothetical protein
VRLWLSVVLMLFLFSPAAYMSVPKPMEYLSDEARFANQTMNMISSNSSTFIGFTWTSRWESYPQTVTNDSELIGDHVVLNATFLSHEGFIEPFEMTMNITGINTTITSSENSVVYDTYPARSNFSTSIIIRIDNGVNETILKVWNSLFICNFFKPIITVNAPVEMSSHYFNITWFSTDRNEDDTAYYSVWISSDGGETYCFLRQNMTQTFYLWNSTGWLETSYDIRVRAYSVDLSFFGGPFVNIPHDYWPGDYADGYWFSFAHVVISTTQTTTLVNPIPFIVSGVGIGAFLLIASILLYRSKRR